MDLSGVLYLAVALVVVVNVVMLLRPAPPLDRQLSAKKISVTTNAPADAAFAMATAGPNGKARLVSADATGRKALFADAISLFSWGFYYLAEFVPLPNGQTEITIAIRSKGFQVGPLVTRALRKFADELESRVAQGATSRSGVPPSR